MEIRLTKSEYAQTSPVVSTNHLPNSLKNWARLHSLGCDTNSLCDESPAYLTSLLFL